MEPENQNFGLIPSNYEMNVTIDTASLVNIAIAGIIIIAIGTIISVAIKKYFA